MNKITMAHGSGGRDSAELMRGIFGKHFSNDILNRLEDGAVLPSPAAPLVVSTDSFVVTPLEFRGGDIGKLAVCGTVNDILMMGAIPKYLTCGFILEEGLDIALLNRIAASMAAAAREADVQIVAGDTKVVESRDGGLMVNTTGIGTLRNLSTPPSAANARPGDTVIVSGNLGDHHACILSARMGIENGIGSDCAILTEIADSLFNNDIDVHVMRDVTRGGLGTVLNEIAAASGVAIELSERVIPVGAEVRAFCGVMGLDPIYMGNEGKLVAIVPQEQEARALELIRGVGVGRDARAIGTVLKPDTAAIREASTCAGQRTVGAITPAASLKRGDVVMRTKVGGTRRIGVLFGEGLPRIC
jgi:hydrogenase expression/formation protein HypE